MSKEPLKLSLEQLEFVKRRCKPHIRTYQSLETVVESAYIQGMFDAVEVLIAQQVPQ